MSLLRLLKRQVWLLTVGGPPEPRDFRRLESQRPRLVDLTRLKPLRSWEDRRHRQSL
jgi:hypothetical protein